MENLIEVANFAAGTRAAPAFERSDGGAHRMVNYVVDEDGEVMPRPGVARSYEDLQYLYRGVISDTPSTIYDSNGPLVATENSVGTRRLFRLEKGSSYIIDKDKLFVAHPDAENYWVDLSGNVKINVNKIFRWHGDGERAGQSTDSGISFDTMAISPTDTPLISHPLFVGLDSQPPSPDNVLELIIQMGAIGTQYNAIKVYFRQDDFAADTVWWSRFYTVVEDQAVSLRWDGRDERDEDQTKYINQEEFDNTYFEIILGLYTPPQSGTLDDAADDSRRGAGHPRSRPYTGRSPHSYGGRAGTRNTDGTYTNEDVKRRYYLFGHRDRSSDIASGIGSSIQAGTQLFNIGASFPGLGTAIGAGVGGVAAAAGIAGTLINRFGEGDRVSIPKNRLNLTPANTDVGERGFYQGPVAICFTYSVDATRNVEGLPSHVGMVSLFDFDELRSGQRTNQRIEFLLPEATTLPEWASCLNIYAARTTELFEGSTTPQETGLEFQLIKQIERTGGDVEWVYNDINGNIFDDITTKTIEYDDGSHRTTIWLWEDERVAKPEMYLESTDNDFPQPRLDSLVTYGSRIWGVNREDESIVYSKLAPYGLHWFPFENALVPQSISLDDRFSKIVKIYPAPNDSMLYVFKRDRIHFIRGHGDIKGLHSPNTPIDINIDASVKKENIGTSSPNSVATLKDIVLFLGSDKILYTLSGTSVRPFSLSIQPHIEKYTDTELEDVVAFEYRNCYHMCLPDEMLVLDLQKKYWTIHDLQIRDVFWFQDSGHDRGDNILFAIDDGGNLLEMFDTLTSDEFTCEWESNPIKVPYQSVISGIHVYHDESAKGPITVGVKVNNGYYKNYNCVPNSFNRFRQGIHARGHRIQIKVVDSNEPKLRIDRIALETTQ